jgi:catalase
MSFPQTMDESKVRGKPERFAEHYNQATLFWDSQSDVEKAHIIGAFRFELSKVQIAGIRQRVVAQLRNVAQSLAEGVADGLGMTEIPDPLPRILKETPKAEIGSSGALSLFAHPGQEGIKTRRVAILVADGVDGGALASLHSSLLREGAVPRFVGVKLGRVKSESGNPIDVEVTLEAGPAVLWDAMVLPDGKSAVETLLRIGQVIEFIKDQYRHCKAILALGVRRDRARGPRAGPGHGGDPDHRRRQ